MKFGVKSQWWGMNILGQKEEWRFLILVMHLSTQLRDPYQEELLQLLHVSCLTSGSCRRKQELDISDRSTIPYLLSQHGTKLASLTSPIDENVQHEHINLDFCLYRTLAWTHRTPFVTKRVFLVNLVGIYSALLVVPGKLPSAVDPVSAEMLYLSCNSICDSVRKAISPFTSALLSLFIAVSGPCALR